MTAPARRNSATGLRSWKGDVEADYRYTTGIAGERFFTELREHGRLVTARCPACDRTYLPPRIYCEECLGPTADGPPVEGPAVVEAVTVTHIDVDGTRRPTPEVWAILRWDGIHGGLVHRLAVPANRAKPGLRVRPVLRPRGARVGNLTDIVEFAPQGTIPKGRLAPRGSTIADTPTRKARGARTSGKRA
ncbi:MAG TPA: zinc ribbon domain-containing protein [Thermoplasmata archaeon]